ncbi:cadherin-23-like [Crassostrea angulata]|uniref:cadherin-23-like n=1 Tax=Magallana angulata TaxID=2784310 RepID=UPI0022B169ED|nr:cadherin-23-like [Crassostrea angulata]
MSLGQCSPDTMLGATDPGKTSIRSVDPETGLGILLNGDESTTNSISYAASCCGVIKRWSFKPITAGTIKFQIWRPTTTTGIYSLVGTNSYSVTSSELEKQVTYDVSASERIRVQRNDVFGFFTSSLASIGYKDLGGTASTVAYTKSITIGPLSEGATFDWSTGTAHVDRREYALQCTLDPDNAVSPAFTNLDYTLTVYDETPPATSLYTVSVIESPEVTMTTATTLFTFDSNSKVLVSAGPLPIGTYVLEFELSSDCGYTDSKSLNVIVVNSLPIIYGIPSTTSIREDHSSEKVMFSFIVYDRSLPMDTITCSLDATPSTDIFSLTEEGPGGYDIKIKDSPNLDYMVVPEYTLSVSCSDQKDSVTEVFTVEVTENKDPEATNLPASIEYNAPDYLSGDVIYSVSATDPEKDSLSFSLTCTTTPCPFAIHPRTGVITMTADLTSIAVSSLDLLVTFSDGYNTVGPLPLSLTIVGLNSPPVITNLPVSEPISIPENSPQSLSVYQILTTDNDPDDVHTYTASFSPTSGESLFAIDENSGLISTSSSSYIDYESLSVGSFIMSVTVSDGTGQDIKELHIDVTDINEAPTFISNTFSISGNEGEAGTILESPDFGVTDPDADSVLSFSIACSELSIDPNTGSLSLKSDYDVDIPGTPMSFTCNVIVSDGELTDTASLNVVINNINDNTPTFTTSTYEFSVFADIAVNDIIGSVTASDDDIGEFGTFTYSLDQISLGMDYFGIHEGGQIYVKESLLSFTSGSSLTVTATDTGDLSGSATVTVVILNSPPVISNLPLTSVLTVPENSGLSASVFQVLVDDINSDDTHTYTATINPEIGSSLFSIGANSGLVSTSSSDVIDYEENSVHSFVMSITVSDGKDVNVKQLLIDVTNVNEAPIFLRDIYFSSGSEGGAGTILESPDFSVTDPDADSVLSFSIACSELSIDPNTGSLFLKSDYDVDIPGTPMSFTCNVIVSDGELTDTASLNVVINNINDNTPTFTTSTYEFSVFADIAVNDIIGSVTASDDDIGEFGTFTYSLDQTSLGMDYFGIHEGGQIYVKESLLTFTSGSSLTVTATDTGNLSGSVTVTVVILNSPPVISNLPLTSVLTVPENSGLSASVFQVLVDDINSDDTHTYTATVNPEIGSSLFSIDANSGLVSTSSSDVIDYEEYSVHSFVMSITVSDGKDVNVKQLLIDVTNVNEAPIFLRDIYFSSGSEGGAGTILESPDFSVTDPDADSVLSFSMACSELSIDPNTGSLSLKSDYDVDIPGTPMSFTCNVIVSDGELTDTASLNVVINNINDNTPTFTTSTYEFSVFADIAVNDIIGSVTASDDDIGEFGTFTYSLDQTSLGMDYFGIHEGGQIYVKESLLTFTSGSSLTVTATDTGDLSGSVTVTVVILNSPPVISNLPLTSVLTVPENSGLSASVFQVLVDDINSDDTHTYTATVNPEIGSSLFSIDANSGLVSTSSSDVIDYEGYSVHSFVMSITVSDGKDVNVKQLLIDVTNVNEAPIFLRDGYFSSGSEGEAGTILESPDFGVLDPDADSLLSFSIACSELSIDPNTGSLSLKGDYDVDIPGTPMSFTCNVIVSDGELTDTASLNVVINNINDNSPTFTTSTYEFSVFADIAVNDIIGSVTATDDDIGEFGTFTYSLDQTSLGMDYFGIHEDGQIFVKESLLTFTSGSSLTVTATDTGDLSGSATVTVVILNSPPVISNLPLTSVLTVPENSGLSASVFQVLVDDINSDDTHTYTATFNPEIGSSLFSIDANSGLVKTSAFTRIDFESLSKRTSVMQVTVSDGEMEDVGQLILEIADENEAPVFGRDSYNVYGNEGKAGELFGRVEFDVNDPDTADVLRLDSLCPGFDLDSNTGEITLSADYDVDVPGTPTSVTCDVTVSDGQLTDTALLVIGINNLNDNSPIFHNNSYTFVVKVNSSSGSFVGVVSAIDNDVGQFGIVKYQLLGVEEQIKYFNISDEGELMTKEVLPIEFSSKVFELTVKAEDVDGKFDKASILVLLEPPSDVMPMVNDRHLTFLEDPKNIAWVATVGAVLALCAGLATFAIIRNEMTRVAKPYASNKIDKWVEPRKKGSPVSLSYSQWEPWHIKDF